MTFITLATYIRLNKPALLIEPYFVFYYQYPTLIKIILRRQISEFLR